MADRARPNPVFDPTVVMPSAQEAYTAMLKHQIGPRFRDLGLTGSGAKWRLPVDGWYALIGFQKSRHSSGRAVSFTLNLLVVSRAEWEDLRFLAALRGIKPPARPNPTAWQAEPAWSMRIGNLMPARADRWWEVSAGSLTAPVARDVIDAVHHHGLPAMRARITERESGSAHG